MSGTSGSIRHALELSITVAPAAAKRGAWARLPVAPAEKSAMSIPVGSAPSMSSMMIVWPANSTAVPADRAVAKSRRSRIGKARSARISRMTVPTWPVAPTTATESPDSEMRVMTNVLRVRGWRPPSLPGLSEGERVPATGLVERPRREVDSVRTDGGDAHEQRQGREPVRTVVPDDRPIVGRRKRCRRLEQREPRGKPVRRVTGIRPLFREGGQPPRDPRRGGVVDTLVRDHVGARGKVGGAHLDAVPR